MKEREGGKGERKRRKVKGERERRRREGGKIIKPSGTHRSLLALSLLLH